jgi:hypothetical protein
MVQVQRLEPVHNAVRRFASDVGRDLVARGFHGCAGVHDDVGDTGFAVEDVEHRSSTGVITRKCSTGER